MKKPREFWIKPETNYSHAIVLEGYDPGCLLQGLIHTREVLPDEPDWRDLCEEMAEALKGIRALKGKTLLGWCCAIGACVTDEDVCSARVTAANAFYETSGIAHHALQKYEAAKAKTGGG